MVTFVESHMTTEIRDHDPTLNPNTPLHHYLELARKGHNTGKIQVHHHRLYRHGQSHHPRGVHDFQNLQWDPSIYRGKTFRDFREKNMPPFTRILNAYKYCNSNAKLQETTPLKKPKMTTPLRRIKLGGILRPSTMELAAEDAKSEGRKRKQGMTGMGWEEFIIEQAASPLYKDALTQSDQIKDSSQLTSILLTPQKCVTTAIGPSQSVEANIPYIGSAEKDNPINPMITTVSSKVLEQSLLESMEEQELQRVHVEVRKYMEKRMAGQAKTSKLIENEVFMLEQRLAAKVLLDKQLKQENDAEQRIAAAIFASQVSKIVVDGTFYTLQKMDYIQSLENAVSSSLDEYCKEGLLRLISPITTMILNDIIHNANVAIETDAILLTSNDYSPPPNTEASRFPRKSDTGSITQTSETGSNIRRSISARGSTAESTRS